MALVERGPAAWMKDVQARMLTTTQPNTLPSTLSPAPIDWHAQPSPWESLCWERVTATSAARAMHRFRFSWALHRLDRCGRLIKITSGWMHSDLLPGPVRQQLDAQNVTAALQAAMSEVGAAVHPAKIAPLRV